jgi:CheY-like chemotaxis protein
MPAHILIVDDEPEVLELLKEMVASLGYNVSTARDGAEALAALLACSQTPS